MLPQSTLWTSFKILLNIFSSRRFFFFSQITKVFLFVDSLFLKSKSWVSFSSSDCFLKTSTNSFFPPARSLCFPHLPKPLLSVKTALFKGSCLEQMGVKVFTSLKLGFWKKEGIQDYNQNYSIVGVNLVIKMSKILPIICLGRFSESFVPRLQSPWVITQLFLTLPLSRWLQVLHGFLSTPTNYPDLQTDVRD